MSQKNPVSESKKKVSNRLTRVGGWIFPEMAARVATRESVYPGYRYIYSGFRIARTKK